MGCSPARSGPSNLLCRCSLAGPSQPRIRFGTVANLGPAHKSVDVLDPVHHDIHMGAVWFGPEHRNGMNAKIYRIWELKIAKSIECQDTGDGRLISATAGC